MGRRNASSSPGNIIFSGTLQERSAGIYLRHIVNGYQFLARGLWSSQFLASGNLCREIFESWWLVVINVLSRGGS